MTLKDQVDFLIAETGIHAGPVAWKLGAAQHEERTKTRVFSIRHFNRFQQAANSDTAPGTGIGGDVPISFDRTAFGGAPVPTSPRERG